MEEESKIANDVTQGADNSKHGMEISASKLLGGEDYDQAEHKDLVSFLAARSSVLHLF